MLTGLATQLDMLAQRPNFEDWGDVLIIAVMAILWLAGALAKVLTSRRAAGQQQPQGPPRQQRRRETWQERLARKAEEMQRAAEARSRQPQQPARARSERGPARASRPPAGKVIIRQGPRGESVMVYERPTAQPDTERQQQAVRQREARKAVLAAGRQAAKAPPVEPRIEVGGPGSEPVVAGITAAMREPPQPLQPEIARTETAREPTGGFLPSAIIDYNDPDALRKAIFHYEILGKPLALRDLSEPGDSF